VRISHSCWEIFTLSLTFLLENFSSLSLILENLAFLLRIFQSLSHILGNLTFFLRIFPVFLTFLRTSYLWESHILVESFSLSLSLSVTFLLRIFPFFLTFFLQSFPVTYLLRICLIKLGFGELEREREREGGR
jgi:hypothetical protein